MQTLAQDVGGLKRVLSNVKTRGNIGEIQLSMLLESNTRRMYIPGKDRMRSLNSQSSSPGGMMPENSYTFP